MTTFRPLLPLFASLGLIIVGACGDDDPTPGSGVTPDGGTSSSSSSSSSGSTADGSTNQEGGITDPIRCPATANTATTTYYMANQEPGADNETCDGKAPTNEGNGHCPFKDFSTAKMRGLLVNVASTRLELRAGTYFVDKNPNLDAALTGIIVQGTGTSDAERVILTSYQNEEAIIDGNNATREAVRISGSFVSIERVRIQNSGGHNIEARGGNDLVIRCNRIGPNMASDNVKGDGEAGPVIVRANEFLNWDSQAIDLTEVHDWTIEDNDIHDAKSTADNKGGAIGTKKNARDITVKNNRIRNCNGVVSGTSTAHTFEWEAQRIVYEGNRFTDIGGPALKLYSCKDCAFRNNTVDGAAAMTLFNDVSREGPGGCPGGCKPSSGAIVTGNKARRTSGPPAALFQGMYNTEKVGFTSSDNLYCFAAGATPGFFYDAIVDFDAWKTSTGADANSSVKAETDPACMNW